MSGLCASLVTIARLALWKVDTITWFWIGDHQDFERNFAR